MEIKQNHLYMKISIRNNTQRHDSKEPSGSFFNLWSLAAMINYLSTAIATIPLKTNAVDNSAQ